MARASTCTKLSLDKYAQIMGINPAAFNGVSYNGCAYATCDTCMEYWYQYAWQKNDRLSREDLARAIHVAERDIEAFLGTPLCPEKCCDTFEYRGNCHHQPVSWNHHPILAGSGGYYPGGYPSRRVDSPSYELSRCPAWAWGQTSDQVVAHTAEWISSEIQCMGSTLSLRQTMRITIVVSGEWDDSHICEFKVYPSDHSGDCAYEIRSPYRSSSSYDSLNDETTFVLDFHGWQMIIPEIWDEPPKQDDSNVYVCGVCPIDGFDPEVYLGIDDLSVIWTTIDPSLPSVEFGWEPASSACGCGYDDCSVCTKKTHPGCLVQGTRIDERFVIVQPATYTDGSWCKADWECMPAPDFVKIHYWHGLDTEGCGCGTTHRCDVLCPSLEDVIADLATARLKRALCGCSCGTSTWWDELQTEWTLSTQASSYFVPNEIASNKFGTRYGEIKTYRSLSLLYDRLCGSVRTGIL